MLAQTEGLSDPQLSPTAQSVLQRRYLRKNVDGEIIETAKEMFWRVASAIAGVEHIYGLGEAETKALAMQFYHMMSTFKFLPNSPTIMNAGTHLGQLSACFVLPVGDSIEEIFDAIKHAALIHKSGGGTGFSFSRLRPKNSPVGTTGGVASGPISFLKIFNTATEQIKQGGTRRGANMGILRVDHPDIIEFIKAKENEGELNNFNLSVALTEEFMQAVESNSSYPLITPYSGEIVEYLPAREIFNLLVDKAWQSGDPGIIFLDRINRDNPTPASGSIEATNPCGEQPLLPYEACNLGSINLAVFYLSGLREEEWQKRINWEALKKVIHLSVRFLDNVIDASLFPLSQITEKVKANRKIGLGIMGFADLLFQLGIPYNSEEALKVADSIMNFINMEAHKASHDLALVRGPFPAYEQSLFFQQKKGPYRNATVTTIAPTGSLSIIAGCSSGIEPAFALCLTRSILDGEKFVEINPYFEKILQEKKYPLKEIKDMIISTGTLEGVSSLPREIRDVFVTTMEIEPIWHLKMQAAFQKHTDNAVSKTVNLPRHASRKDIHDIYWSAWKEGCKGVTVYRDGCKNSQVLYKGTAIRNKNNADGPGCVRKRPEVVKGFTQKVQTGLGAMYLTVNEIDGEPFEVFATIGKSGRSITAKAEAIGRLVSLALRSGIPVKDIVDQIKGIGGEHPIFRNKGLLLSIPDAIAWVLENNYLENASLPDQIDLLENSCPECGSALVLQEGCLLCTECGYSKCG